MEEVRVNLGTEHEQDFVASLIEAGIASPGHSTGGNLTDAYVCDFLTEVKKELHAHWIQKSMHWINSSKGWVYESQKNSGRFLETMARRPDVLRYINEKWGAVHRRYENIHGEDVRKLDKDRPLTPHLGKIEEAISLPDEFMFEMIRAFYFDKKCTYIHVGDGYGLYHLYEDHGRFGTPKLGNGTASLSARLKMDGKKNKQGLPGYWFQLQLEVTKLPKSPIDLNDPDMLQEFVGKHRDGFVSGDWKDEHWDRLSLLVPTHFIKDLAPKRVNREQISTSIRI